MRNVPDVIDGLQEYSEPDKERMLEWIEQLGLIVVQSEIKPYGPGTRRYHVGSQALLLALQHYGLTKDLQPISENLFGGRY